MENTRLAGVKRIELAVFGDARGYFVESFQDQRYAALFCDDTTTPFFVQDNSSFSRKGVLRGLHFQHQHPQGKLIHVSHGKIFDVAVDLRCDSPTFGQWEGMVLQGIDFGGSGANGCSVPSEKGPATLTQLWIPPGFAHGFVVLSDTAMVHYKCTDYYHPEDQVCLRWNDRDLAIDWPMPDPILSERDSRGDSLSALLNQGMLLERGQVREKAQPKKKRQFQGTKHE